MTLLIQLQLEIDSRVSAIRAAQPDWLCGKGCDKCCRHLADVPQLTPAEWVLLREALQAMPSEQLAQVRERIAVLAEAAPRPVTCPMLDLASGACPVYAGRPVACRTYGFYVERDQGLYCSEIEAQERAGELSEVVWGNHERVTQVLAQMGEARALTVWFAEWDAARQA